MIQTDDQMLLAQQCVGNLRRILLAARKVHSQQDYTRIAEPILLEIQQREQEILALLAQGYLYKEIADKLGITLNTMKTHQHAIYEKLHVQSRTEATLKFLRRD